MALHADLEDLRDLLAVHIKACEHTPDQVRPMALMPYRLPATFSYTFRRSHVKPLPGLAGRLVVRIRDI